MPGGTRSARADARDGHMTHITSQAVGTPQPLPSRGGAGTGDPSATNATAWDGSASSWMVQASAIDDRRRSAPAIAGAGIGATIAALLVGGGLYAVLKNDGGFENEAIAAALVGS